MIKTEFATDEFKTEVEAAKTDGKYIVRIFFPDGSNDPDLIAYFGGFFVWVWLASPSLVQ